ncbi:MAG TPA: DinB family protein [Acidobacteriaceae bacterium]|nr:DinB family protein [Acidobacteriaceae bacterium]
MKMRIPVFLSLAACLAPLALAQTIANPITSTVKSVMAKSEQNMIASAQAMPADRYGYKPTPPQITFRHLIKHATMANYFFCSKLTGAAMPAAASGVMQGTPSKSVLIARLEASYAYCRSRFANETDTGLGDPIHLFGPQPVSRGGAMIIMTNDWTDHYAIAAYYLRLNGILPPTARGHR